VPRFFKCTPAGVPRIPASPGDVGEAIGAALLTNKSLQNLKHGALLFAFSKAVESRISRHRTFYRDVEFYMYNGNAGVQRWHQACVND
jgi:hypothetical protein